MSLVTGWGCERVAALRQLLATPAGILSSSLTRGKSAVDEARLAAAAREGSEALANVSTSSSREVGEEEADEERRCDRQKEASQHELPRSSLDRLTVHDDVSKGGKSTHVAWFLWVVVVQRSERLLSGSKGVARRSAHVPVTARQLRGVAPDVHVPSRKVRCCSAGTLATRRPSLLRGLSESS